EASSSRASSAPTQARSHKKKYAVGGGLPTAIVVNRVRKIKTVNNNKDEECRDEEEKQCPAYLPVISRCGDDAGR
ncbi:hypothetical protein, partial [Pseudomonas corrugata]|uniref:hypothetical protein n=1 Tax=Pseudomonas corrugata TaxID=47879 RepID=UPI0019D6CBE7